MGDIFTIRESSSPGAMKQSFGRGNFVRTIHEGNSGDDTAHRAMRNADKAHVHIPPPRQT